MTNTPDNDRHERALEKAARVMVGFTEQSLGCDIGDIFKGPDADGGFEHHGTWKREISEIIAAYLSEMDAVIVPREPTDAMVEAGAVARIRAIRPTVETYSAMLSAVPHHFNQEGK